MTPFFYVTSVNIACGFHAGDPSVIRETIRVAAAAGLRIGAHPGIRTFRDSAVAPWR